jgi:hypothetical protein
MLLVAALTTKKYAGASPIGEHARVLRILVAAVKRPLQSAASATPAGRISDSSKLRQ